MIENESLLERTFSYEEVQKLVSLNTSRVLDVGKMIIDSNYDAVAEIDFLRKWLRLYTFPHLVLDDFSEKPYEPAFPMSYDCRNLWYKLLIYKKQPLSAYSDKELVFEVLEQIRDYK